MMYGAAGHAMMGLSRQAGVLPLGELQWREIS